MSLSNYRNDRPAAITGTVRHYYRDIFQNVIFVKSCQQEIKTGFNNLQYQNYTPLYKLRRTIDPGKYTDKNQCRAWYDKLRNSTPHILIMPPSPFSHVAGRMIVELATNIDQIQTGIPMLRKNIDTDLAYKKLMDSRVLDTPYFRIEKKSGQIVAATE